MGERGSRCFTPDSIEIRGDRVLLMTNLAVPVFIWRNNPTTNGGLKIATVLSLCAEKTKKIIILFIVIPFHCFPFVSYSLEEGHKEECDK